MRQNPKLTRSRATKSCLPRRTTTPRTRHLSDMPTTQTSGLVPGCRQQTQGSTKLSIRGLDAGQFSSALSGILRFPEKGSMAVL